MLIGLRIGSATIGFFLTPLRVGTLAVMTAFAELDPSSFGLIAWCLFVAMVSLFVAVVDETNRRQAR